MMRRAITVGVAAAWLISVSGQPSNSQSVDWTTGTVETELTATLSGERYAEIDALIAVIEAQRTAAILARARNAEIDASIAAVGAARAAQFARGRNAESEASVAAVACERAAVPTDVGSSLMT